MAVNPNNPTLIPATPSTVTKPAPPQMPAQPADQMDDEGNPIGPTRDAGGQLSPVPMTDPLAYQPPPLPTPPQSAAIPAAPSVGGPNLDPSAVGGGLAPVPTAATTADTWGRQPGDPNFGAAPYAGVNTPTPDPAWNAQATAAGVDPNAAGYGAGQQSQIIKNQLTDFAAQNVVGHGLTDDHGNPINADGSPRVDAHAGQVYNGATGQWESPSATGQPVAALGSTVLTGNAPLAPTMVGGGMQAEAAANASQGYAPPALQPADATNSGFPGVPGGGTMPIGPGTGLRPVATSSSPSPAQGVYAPGLINTEGTDILNGGNGVPVAAGTTPPAVNAPPATNGNAPVDVTNPLTSQQLQVGPLADRFGIAQQQLDAYRQAQEPAFQAQLRDAIRAAAAGGAIGSGSLQSHLGDVVANRQNAEQAQGMTFLQDALSGSIGDQFATTGIDQQQQQFQEGQQNTGFNQAVTLQELQDALQNSQQNRAVSTLNAGNTGDPTSLLATLSQIFGGQSSAAGQSLAELIRAQSGAKPAATTGTGSDTSSILQYLQGLIGGGGSTPTSVPIPVTYPGGV